MKIDESIFLTPENSNPSVLAAKQRFGIVGNSPALIAAIDRAVKVAPIDLSVLVTGESGTGKEFFPQIIHQGSPRRHARYIAVNCGAIPEGTIDSELFGHEKGAFTGAIATRNGYFEEADGGTIFLDEVAELPLTTQARLLRVLETGEFMKVGSSAVQKTNVRIVAATNVDLRRAIADGSFREDLFYRLSTVGINVPPLRDRGNDIELLARNFASKFVEKYHTPSTPVFDPEARLRLLSYNWPGNVRQLKNVIEQICLFEAGKTVTAEILDSYLSPVTPGGARHAAGTTITRTNAYDREREMLLNMILTLRSRVDELTKRLDDLDRTSRPADTVEAEDVPGTTTALIPCPKPRDTQASAAETLAQSEKRAIAEALERNDGRRRAVAKELGMAERTLYRKIKEYGLE